MRLNCTFWISQIVHQQITSCVFCCDRRTAECDGGGGRQPHLPDGAPGHLYGNQGDGHSLPGRRHETAPPTRKVERHLVPEDAASPRPKLGPYYGL